MGRVFRHKYHKYGWLPPERNVFSPLTALLLRYCWVLSDSLLVFTQPSSEYVACRRHLDTFCTVHTHETSLASRIPKPYDTATWCLNGFPNFVFALLNHIVAVPVLFIVR